jgi:hypothetical protein
MSELKRHVKILYGVKPNRPARNSARDLKVWELRQQHPTWSLMQIGRQVGLKANQVSEALTRQQHRHQERNAVAGMILELMADALREFQRRQAVQNSETRLPIN